MDHDREMRYENPNDNYQIMTADCYRKIDDQTQNEKVGENEYYEQQLREISPPVIQAGETAGRNVQFPGIGDEDENTSVQNFNMGIRKSSLLLPSDFIGIDERNISPS